MTFNTLVQGAWSLLLSLYSGRDDVVFGATRACRRSSVDGAESMVGLLINTLPVRVRVDGSASLRQWLNELRVQWVAMREHEHTPLTKVQLWSDVQAGKPLFETIVVLENSRLETTIERYGGAVRRLELRGITPYPLVLSGFAGPSLLIEFSYDRRRFEDAAMARVSRQLHTLLEGMAENSERTLDELPILSPSEARQLVVEWNNTAAPLPLEGCIPRLFEAQVERTPQATALVSGENRFTYHELNVRANRLGHYLRRLGVGPDTPVAICLERSAEMVIGLLAILKAGGAYVPLDPSYPGERLLFMLHDTGAHCFVDSAEFARPPPGPRSTDDLPGCRDRHARFAGRGEPLVSGDVGTPRVHHVHLRIDGNTQRGGDPAPGGRAPSVRGGLHAA